jgi:hypothetical protein
MYIFFSMKWWEQRCTGCLKKIIQNHGKHFFERKNYQPKIRQRLDTDRFLSNKEDCKLFTVLHQIMLTSINAHYFLHLQQTWLSYFCFRSQTKQTGKLNFFFQRLPCSPERNSVSIIRIRLRKVIKYLKLSDFSQTNSNNTHWVSFGGTR